MATLFCAALSSRFLHVTASFMTLSSIQQISGFSTACSNAYDTPLTKCTESDFEKGRTCSLDCVALLEKVSALINTECKGTKAYPNTLIGLFFKDAGVAALCPSAQVSGGSSSSSGGNSASSSGGGQTLPTTTTIQTPRATPIQTTQSTKAGVSTTKQAAQTTTSVTSPTTSLLKSTVLNTPAAVRPTIDSASTLTQSGLAGLRSSVAVASATGAHTTSTSSSAKAKSTNHKDQDDRNGNSGSSGGTPFDITSSSSRFPVSLWTLVWTVGLGALIRIV